MDHYDFVGPRCVKDLNPDTMLRGDGSLHLGFRHNCWKHDEDLGIRYIGVDTVDLPDCPDGA